MSDRLDNTVDNQIITAMENINAEIIQIKSSQRTSGDSFKFFQDSNDTTYDWSGKLPQSAQAPGTGIKMLQVSAIAKNQSIFYGDLIVELYVNGSRWLNANTLQAYKNGTTPFSKSVYEGYGSINELNRKRWDVAITGDKTTTCQIKCYVVSNDDVDIIIEEMN